MLSVFMCFYQKLSSSLNTILIADKQCSDICYDKFPVPQIDGKIKVKDQCHEKFYLQSIWGETRYFKHRKYQNLWTNNKITGNKNAICSHLLPYLLNICRKFEFLISQVNVATILR